MRYWLLAQALFSLLPALYAADEPRPEIFSPMTLLGEESQIENPKASLNGKVESVLWQQKRIEAATSGDAKEILLRSRLTKYDPDNQPIDETDHQIGETHSTNTYENGRLVSTRGKRFNQEGKQVGEEFWQTYQYDAAGRLLDLKRGSGEKLENHFVS
jgi:hypothetical protein